MSLKKLAFSVALILILPLANTAHAEQYASAKEARDAAIKAMKDFQSSSAECKDVTNAKFKLTPTEVTGIKIVLEHSKTLLEECTVPEIFSEESVKALAADNGSMPAKTTDVYADYVTEFEAYSDSIQAVIDDINTAMPNLKDLGRALAERNSDLANYDQLIQKFEASYSSYSAETKSLLSANPAWSTYQNLKNSLPAEKDNYKKALSVLDALDRIADLDTAAENVISLFNNKLSVADLSKSISDLTALATPKVITPAKPANDGKSKSVTISCVKGKLIKKVTAANPKCPAGYVKK